MTPPSRPGLSRRALFGLGGSALLLATATATVAWRRWPSRAVAASSRNVPPIAYADHDGWMVSPAEKQALRAQQQPPGGGSR